MNKTLTAISRFTFHVSQKKRAKRKAAFTLAEVLITLAIIGVVAAMTLPTLVQNYQKTALKSQFKKAYSTAQNAYKMAEAQLGFQPACYYAWDNIGASCEAYGSDGFCIKYGEAVNPTNQTSDCLVLREQLKKTYKVVKICEGHALRDGCIPAYKGNDTVYKESHPDTDDVTVNIAISGCGGFSESSIHNTLHVWNLSDGTIIIWYSNRLFALDVNGMKGPNKWGYDVFAFTVYKHRSGAIKLQPSDSCTVIEDGGVNTSQMLKDIYQ